MHALWMTAWLLAAAPAGANPATETQPMTKAQPVAEKQPAKAAATAGEADREPLYESDAETDAALKTTYELKTQIREALKREATSAKDSEEHLAATLELVALFAAVQANEHFAPDEALRLKTQIRSRLMKIAGDLKNDLKREAAAEARAAKMKANGAPASRGPEYRSPGEQAVLTTIEVAGSDQNSSAAKSGLSLPKETLLFQIGAAMGQQNNGATEAGEALIEVIKGSTGRQKWDDVGGPGSIFLWKGSSLMQPLRQVGANAFAGAMGGQAVSDHGPELVELIESVIAPNTWEKNGGFGSIFYFAPLHVIVVRSTGEVHGNVGNVIGNLRAAGN
jgi:hypothetical protein